MIRGCPGKGRQRGLTIVEIVATIAILGIALTGIALILRQGTAQSANTLLETRAVALGYAYLDEIMSKRFDELSAPSGLAPCYDVTCTPEGSFGPDGGGESRDRYDDVDDYHGLAEGDGEATPLRDAEGTTRDGYENFRVAVSVRYAGDDAVLGYSNETEAKLVTVEVSYRGLPESWRFSAYRGNY